MAIAAVERPHIFLVEDDEALCLSLQQFLAASGYDVTGLSSAPQAIECLKREADAGEARQSVALVDLHLRGGLGFEVQQAAHALSLPMPFVFMSAELDARAVSQAWRGGAIDFLFKPFTSEELLETLQKASPTPQSATSPPAGSLDPDTLRMFKLLTARQKEVLQRVAAGRSNTQIATELNIATRTVKMHREAIMHRFGFQHLADLIRFHDACADLLASAPEADA